MTSIRTGASGRFERFTNSVAIKCVSTGDAISGGSNLVGLGVINEPSKETANRAGGGGLLLP